MEESKLKDGYYSIRPAGRHITTIGKDLIKDKYAAIVELVKNAYDADSPYCKISLLPFTRVVSNGDSETQVKGIRIEIKDEGHGMTYDTIVNKWMVPSTDDKLIRKKSPNGRIMQGRKGVGRYAASVIGDDLVLQTVDTDGELTTLYLIWKDFEDAKYLADVKVLIENFATDRKKGTEIIIVGDEKHLNDWTVKQIQNLKFELKRLIPPKGQDDNQAKVHTDKFKIQLELGNFPFDGLSNSLEEIEPYPLFELFDYRISGSVSNEGLAKLKFENNRVPNSPPEFIKEFTIFLNKNKNAKLEQEYCGEVNIDFRVFDRDSDSIDNLISRGLKDPNTGNYVGRRQARIILDTYNGVGVFRNGFRIRPLGDAGYDWLELDRDRVQNPSLKIGSDQMIGFIYIQSEEESHLEEKSARDGIKETPEYFGLQEISKQVLGKLQERRFVYRQQIGLGRSNRDLAEKINLLYNFGDLKEKLNRALDNLGVEPKEVETINKIIYDKEVENNKIADELKQAIALYQGQATVGKIVNVILHEGRKPLSYFNNTIPRIAKWSETLKGKDDPELLKKLLDRVTEIGEQGRIFSDLFKKLDPLSSKSRTRKSAFNINTIIGSVVDVFISELESKNISVEIDCDDNYLIYGWKDDFYVVFTNLIDNSIYWLQNNVDRERKILFKVYRDEDNTIIDYKDTGPGIEMYLIESQVIFEPEFSNKTGGGTGLGLAISGEAISRNDGTLKAIYSQEGAYFKIEIKDKLKPEEKD